jgi:hypothetical protein
LFDLISRGEPDDKDYRSDIFSTVEFDGRLQHKKFGERDQAAFFLAAVSWSTPMMSLSFMIK